MRIKTTVIILLLTVIFSDCVEVFSQNRQSYVFDFGSEKSPLLENSIRISEKTTYSKNLGYGLIPEQKISSYNNKKSFFLNERLSNGLTSESGLEFKIDLAPGNYYVEIFMEGGTKSIWNGEVVLNNISTKKVLTRYEENAEGTDPPDDWFMLLQVTNKSNQLQINIKAEGQPTTVSGISIIPVTRAHLWLDNGIIKKDSLFVAPNSNFIIELLNKGAVKEASKLIESIPQSFNAEKALLLIALAGRLETENPRPILEWAKSILETNTNSLDENQDYLRLVQVYIQADENYKMAGWDWAKKHTGEGIFGRMDRAARQIEMGKNVPSLLYNRFVWELGKIAFWAWVEEHGKFTEIVWNECFDELYVLYPEFEPLINYMGKNEIVIPSEDRLSKLDAPDWIKESLISLDAVLRLQHYWAEYRQAENGEFGGKYDDDVEILRWWPITRLASDDSIALVAMHKLVNGIWESPWIYDGFSRKLRDVEHSSEPVSDTQPLMVGLDYGNPVFVERCMMSLRKALNLWTGVNDYGHLHFKSSWYSSTAIDTTKPRDCDVPMNTRTVEAIRWFVWYNNSPRGMDFLKKWSDSWLEDTYRTDKGKPYGVVPSAIRFSDDAIGGHADNWHHPEMFWHYFDFRSGSKMLLQFLSTYMLTGDEKYLEPIKISLKLVEKYEGQNLSEAQEGSEKWVASLFLGSDGFWETVERWRLTVGDSTYDDLLINHGSDYLKYRLTGNYQFLAEGSKKISNGIYNNYYLLTEEGYYTDRIEVGDLHGNDDSGVGHLESMYLGGTMVSGFYPFYNVSWSEFKNEFVSVVTESSETSVTSMIYNASENDETGFVTFWNLEPGIYLFEQSSDSMFTGKINTVVCRDTLQLNFRSIRKEIKVPGKLNQVIRLRRIEPIKRADLLVDLAIAKEEIKVVETGDKMRIEIPVHNIGSKDAKEFTVSLIVDNEIIETKAIKSLRAPLDLLPKVKVVMFEVSKSQSFEIHIDSENKINEITKLNNFVSVKNEL